MPPTSEKQTLVGQRVWKAESGNYQLRKRALLSVQCALLQNFQGPSKFKGNLQG
jgi:hypothetical protein